MERPEKSDTFLGYHDKEYHKYDFRADEEYDCYSIDAALSVDGKLEIVWGIINKESNKRHIYVLNRYEFNSDEYKDLIFWVYLNHEGICKVKLDDFKHFCCTCKIEFRDDEPYVKITDTYNN